MKKLWWYADGLVQRGPITQYELEVLIADGTLSSDTLAWTEGLRIWVPLASVPSSFGLALPSAAPTPAAPSLPHSGTAFSDAVESSYSPAGAGRRFFARTIDTSLTAFVVGLLTGVVGFYASEDFAFWIERPGASVVLALGVVIPLAMVVDAGVYRAFGNTLGKHLLRVRVTGRDGRKLGFAAYLKRNLGVWAFGLAAGIPLLALLTMLYQQRRVSRGDAAGYDAGRYRVDSGPLSPLRKTIVAGLIVCLFSGLFALEVLERTRQRQLQEGFAWSNPVTDGIARVPPGWLFSHDRNELQDPIYTFIAPHENIVAVFAFEELPPGMDVANYHKAFAQAVAGAMTLKPDATQEQVGRWIVSTFDGHLTQDPKRLLKITFVQRDRQVWRFVGIGSHGRHPDVPSTTELRRVLLGTL